MSTFGDGPVDIDRGEETADVPGTRTAPSHLGSKTQVGRSGATQIVLVVLSIIGLALGFLAWAVSSPAGSSPDDDYHLGSIWCPRPIEDSGCGFKTENGQIVSVKVPQSIYEASMCYAFHPEKNAFCTLRFSDSHDVLTPRFDNGAYPLGYYHFHHLFIGEDVFRSAVNMRLINVLIGIGLLGCVVALSRPGVRARIVVSAVVAWVPMGVYFIASNNPTSWALSGCLIFGAALISALESTGKTRVILLALASIGAVLAGSSRADSAFFLFVISLALFFLVRRKRESLPELAVAGVSSIYGLWVFASSSLSGNLTDSGGWPSDEGSSELQIFVQNFLSIPHYLAQLWGFDSGMGWFDVPLNLWSTLAMFFVAGGLAFVGAQDMDWRKLLGSVIVLGALLGVPTVSMTMRHVHPLNFYQGRYMLPLLAVFFVIWLQGKNGSSLFQSKSQLVGVAFFASMANALALRKLITRYEVGLAGPSTPVTTTFEWWPWPVSSSVVWAAGSIGMSLGIVALLIVVWPPSTAPAAWNREGTAGGRARVVSSV